MCWKRRIVNVPAGPPFDSEVNYNWTEFHDEELRKTLADTIITIDGKYSYHLEAQISKDNEIIFRMFEYGFRHANLNREREEDNYILRFPKPVIIYLYYTGEVPDEYTLTLEFDEGAAKFDYTVPVIKLPELTVEELNEKKMVILIRQVLRNYEKGKTPEEIADDLVESVEHVKQICEIIESVSDKENVDEIYKRLSN